MINVATTILILISISITCYSQKCRYTVDKIDEFTNERILETRFQEITSGNPPLYTKLSTSFSARKINDSREIKFVALSMISSFIFEEGAELLLKLENGELLKLSFSQRVESKNVKEKINNTEFWTLSFAFKIDENTFDKLRQFNLQKIRFKMSDREFDSEVKERDAIGFRSLLSCIQ